MALYEERMRTMICNTSSTRPPTPNETMAKNIALLLLLVFFIGWRLYVLWGRGWSALMLMPSLIGVLLAVFLIWSVPITRVTVTEEAVTIRRTIGSRTLKIDDILNVSIEDASIDKGIYTFNAAHPGGRIYARKNVSRGVAFELWGGKAVLICSATPDAFKAAVSLALGKRNDRAPRMD